MIHYFFIRQVLGGRQATVAFRNPGNYDFRNPRSMLLGFLSFWLVDQGEGSTLSMVSGSGVEVRI